MILRKIVHVYDKIKNNKMFKKINKNNKHVLFNNFYNNLIGGLPDYVTNILMTGINTSPRPLILLIYL